MNYRWGTLKSCQNACLNEPTGLCNIVSRYGQKTDTENGHCWFYACANHNYVWTPQTSWGNGASTSRIYAFQYRHHLVKYVNKTRWTNKTVNKINWINKTRWETRWVNKTVNKINWINKTRWETRWINKTNWINKTRWETRWETRWTNKTNWINKTRWETRWETRCVNKTGDALVNTDVGTSSGTKPYKGADTNLDSDILYVIGWLIMGMLLLGCCVRCNRKRELPRAAEVIEIQEIPVDE